MEKRGNEVVFIFVVAVIILSSGTEATHQGVTIALEPADTDPIFVGDSFNVNVMLSVPEGTADPTLYSALLKFRQGTRATFRPPGTLDSDIFDPLEQNLLSSGVWIMDGDGGGTPHTLTTTPVRLGTIPMKASPSGSGTLDVTLDGKSGSVVLEQSPLIGKIPRHLYSVSSLTVNVNIRDHQCGDGIISGTESEATCCIDTGCSGPGICYTERNPNGICMADADSDAIPDVTEPETCRTTGAGYTIFTTGELRGCIIGDIDVDGDIDSDDIAEFISMYNHRDAGFSSSADLDQSTELNSDDIAQFIFHYNRRP